MWRKWWWLREETTVTDFFSIFPSLSLFLFLLSWGWCGERERKKFVCCDLLITFNTQEHSSNWRGVKSSRTVFFHELFPLWREEVLSGKERVIRHYSTGRERETNWKFIHKKVQEWNLEYSLPFSLGVKNYIKGMQKLLKGLDFSPPLFLSFSSEREKVREREEKLWVSERPMKRNEKMNVGNISSLNLFHCRFFGKFSQKRRETSRTGKEK